MLKSIPIFFHSSNEFCPYMAVTMSSILYNTNAFIEFYVIEDGISDFNKRRIESLKEQFPNFSIEWIHFEYNDIFKKEYFSGLEHNLADRPWQGIHAFATPFMPLLKPDIDKFIYLDSDVILLKDIKEFYEQDIENYYVATAPDIVVPLFVTQAGASVNKNIDFSTFGKYFCAGVLLVNAKKFREDNIIDTYFKLAKTEFFPSCDQDILNRLFQNGGFKPLDSKFQFIYQPTQEQLDKRGFDVSSEIFKNAEKNAVIRHFANAKPWMVANEDWSGTLIQNFNEFWFFAKLTPFYVGISKGYESTIQDKKYSAVRYGTPKISIIVPVYNPPEEYFTYCLYSLLNQTLSDIEIILIDNESTGNNSDIIKRFASLDSRIKVFKFEKNCGFAKACNKGLEIASGEYVFIVDSDDYITPDACEKAYNRAVKDNLDVLIFANYVNDCRKNIVSSTVIQNYALDVSSFCLSPATNWILNLYMTVWNKVFRREFLLKNNLCFDTRLSIAAPDICLSLKTFVTAKRINYLNEPLYYYRINLPNNVMAKLQKKGEKLYYQVFAFCNIIDDFIKNSNVKPEIIPYVIRVNLEVLTLNFGLTDKTNKEDFFNKMHEYFQNCDKTIYSKANLKQIGYYQFFKSVLNNSYYSFKFKNRIFAIEETSSLKRIRIFGISIYKRTRDESHKSYKILGLIRFKKKLKKGGIGGV